MAKRSGKRVRGTHHTLCELGARVFDILCVIPGVSGVSPGMLQSGKGVSGGGTQKVKIGLFPGGILLTVRQARSVQELRVFGSNLFETRLRIARALRDAGIEIHFMHQ